MSTALSQDSQVILLLTEPLMTGSMQPSTDLLTPGEYGRLAVFLHEVQRQPGDLLTADADGLLRQCQGIVDGDRLRKLLGRGFLLSQAVERWQTRAIWVVTSADASYPHRFKERLKENAPAVLYGCGDAPILETGLAVIGSRNATPELLAYTEHIGQLAANAQQTVISGGARGIDQASMRGALGAGGTVVGMLADSLERAALNREYRSPLMEGQLVLVSPYDPMTGFNVGNAMQCNKLIYALADAALVISSDYQKDGMWTGAAEQLTTLRLVPVFVRSQGKIDKGLQELQNMGALPWPNPSNAEDLVRTLRPEQDPTTHNEEQAPAPVHESIPEPPATTKTKPAPAKRRSKPRKSAGDIAEPTLFDSTSETKVQNKPAKTPRRETEGSTDADGENGHAED